MRGGGSHLGPVAAPLGRPAWRGERPEQCCGHPRVRVLVAALGGLALLPARCSSPHRTSGLGPRGHGWGAAVSPSVAITVIGRARRARAYPRARRGDPVPPGRLAASPMGPQTTHRPAGMRARARSIAVFTLSIVRLLRWLRSHRNCATRQSGESTLLQPFSAQKSLETGGKGFKKLRGASKELRKGCV